MATSERQDICCICRVSQTKLLLCSRCKQRRYCSATCQKKDWDNGHRTRCKQLTDKTSTVVAASKAFKRSPEFSSLVSIILHGVMSTENATQMRYLTIMMVDKPWKSVTGPTTAYLCVNTVPKAAFELMVGDILKDTGNTIMLQQLHNVPLLRIRVLESSRNATGRTTLRSLGCTQLLTWLADLAHRQTTTGKYSSTVSSKSFISISGDIQNLAEAENLHKQRREYLQEEGRFSAKDDLQELRKLGLTAYTHTVMTVGGDLNRVFAGQQLIQLGYHALDKLFIPVNVLDITQGSMAAAVYAMSSPAVGDDETVQYS